MIFRYPGGKTKLQPLLEHHISKYIERYKFTEFHDVFLGGGSTLITIAKKYPKLKIFANELDIRLFSFWDLIANGSEKEHRLFLNKLDIIPTLNIFYELRETCPNNRVDMAFDFLFFNRTTFSGIYTSGPIGGKLQKSEYNIDCRFNSKNLIKKYLTLVELFKDRLIISNDNAIVYISKMNHNAIYYLDPPYYIKGKQLYSIYMEDNEHQILADNLKLNNFDNWILSYDVCEEVDELYIWAKKTPIDMHYSIDGVKKNWKNTKEYLIFNN